MELSNYHNLHLMTSWVSPYSIKELPEHNLLPIFIARNIANSGLIGKWNGTSIHFKELSPSHDLLREWKSGQIDNIEFEKKFTLELSSINIENVLKRIKYLCDLSNASGAVLMGYGKEVDGCHRGVLSRLINSLGYLDNPIKEIQL